MSTLQQDSESRIARYQHLKSEAAEQGNAVLARKWAKEIAEEQKILAMIVRVEHINASDVFNEYMRHFSAKHRSKDLVAV